MCAVPHVSMQIKPVRGSNSIQI